MIDTPTGGHNAEEPITERYLNHISTILFHISVDGQLEYHRQGNFIYKALFIHKADSKCFPSKHWRTIKKYYNIIILIIIGIK